MFFPNPGYTNNFVFKAMPRRWGADLSYRFRGRRDRAARG
jgi:hypothetical protein